MNILTKYFSTKHNTAPFSEIKNEDYLPAIQEGITLAKAEIYAIIKNPETPTFENTIVAMDYAGEILLKLMTKCKKSHKRFRHYYLNSEMT